MRYLLLIAIIYFVLKSVGKMLSNLKIVDQDSSEVKGGAQIRLKVNESDIEDADFKEVK
jgi:hypothetical protein